MITTVNQISSAWFDDKLVRKSLHNETNFNRREFTGKFCEFIDLIINHNYNKILKSDWFSTALISALIGQFYWTVRVMPK